MARTNFVVDMTDTTNDRTARFYKEHILSHARKLGLTIAGEDIPTVRSGIAEAGMGNLLTVGTAPNHDLEWVRRTEFACEKGYKPVYDIVEDYNAIIENLYKYAYEVNRVMLISGAEATVHDGFIKIGTEIITFDELDKIQRFRNMRVVQ